MKRFWAPLIISTLVATNQSLAENQPETNALRVKPNRCIALHEGQQCYQKLQFSWTTPERGHYCLYQRETDVPLICWQGNDMNRYTYKFESKQNKVFLIRDEDTENIMTETEVSVAWVYKRTKKVTTGWRLF